ncbi:SIMPL domain-containing protein [Flavobacteriaceae sp. LMIT009]
MKSFLTLVFALTFSSILFSQNSQKNFIDQPYIEVIGQAETEIIPNEIYVRIILSENVKKGRISIEKQENKMLAKLRECNIDIDKQLSIDDFNGYYKKRFLANNDLLKTKRYQLLVNDGKTLALVYQKLDEVDVSNISIIRVDHSEMEDFKRETKIKALIQAKQKASDYAIAINQSIGKALYVQETSNTYTPRAYYKAQGISMEDSEVINDIDFKKIIIQEKLLARFAIN